MSNELYNTKYGIYYQHCGLDKLKFSWGHDEYMYRMLVANNALIPDEGLAMIRYHSAYSWHTYNAYEHLCNEKDAIMKEWVKKFNVFDLYTKSSDNKIDVDKVSLDIEIIKSNHLAHIESDINSLNFKTDRIEDKVDKTYWILLTAAGAFIGILLVNLFKLID